MEEGGWAGRPCGIGGIQDPEVGAARPTPGPPLQSGMGGAPGAGAGG
ncbi:hypothetical protein HMPREF9056_00736 [Actinomyces sp. oral taxon 170 str. F0386]|nr:hypothetical protein HMPREF9056_00736 [Actinomyces sp. oral taxon 170 str. F0386]